MHHQKLRSILKAVLSCPTAPFHEYHVRAELIRLLEEIPEVSLTITSYGNLIARYQGSKRAGKIKWVVGSHMDHPGWVMDKNGEPEYLGGLQERYFQNEFNWDRTREFGAFSMWDVPAFEIKKGIVHSRACDDLIGCSLIVALFQELSEIGWQGNCAAVFTRAEEVGFVGATYLAKEWPFSKSAIFLSLETSAPTEKVSMGAGPVCRVGDRRSIFNNDATAELLAAADKESITHQRALLDLGACEATAMQAFGIQSAGISVPLGNYHNQGPDDRIEAEFVYMADVKATLQLLVATITGKGSDSGTKALKKALIARQKQYLPHTRLGDKNWSHLGGKSGTVAE